VWRVAAGDVKLVNYTSHTLRERMRGVSRVQLGRLANMTEAGVRYHIEHGHIQPLPNGRMNPGDAEVLRRMQRVEQAGPDPRTTKLLKVRVLRGRVKIEGIRLQTARLRAQTVERASAEASLAARTDRVIARIYRWPERYAATLAAELDIEHATAIAILTEFATKAIAELGDLREETKRAIDRL
jgi:hypothetical protein